MENDIVSIPRAQYVRWCKRLANGKPTSNMASSSTSSATISDIHNVVCLPLELLLEILGYLTDNQSTLYHVSLVCRQWLFCVTPILYKHPKIYNTYRWATFLLTLCREKRSFEYGSLVHSIDLSIRDITKGVLDKKKNLKLKFKAGPHGSLMATEETGSSSLQPLAAISSTDLNGNIMNTDVYPDLDFEEREDEEDNDGDNDNDDEDDDEDENDDDDDILPHRHPDDTGNNRHETLESVSEDDYYMSCHPFPSVVVSTSSLIQLAQACPNLVAIDLSHSQLFSDSMVKETGEYISTLQDYAITPGLTRVKVPIETAINTVGQQCPHLRQLKLQCCGWVGARVIWYWTVACPNLTYLDARRAVQCTVKRLNTNILQILERQQHPPLDIDNPHGQQNTTTSLSSSSSSSSSSASPSSASSSSSSASSFHPPRQSSSSSSVPSSSSSSSPSSSSLHPSRQPSSSSPSTSRANSTPIVGPPRPIRNARRMLTMIAGRGGNHVRVSVPIPDPTPAPASAPSSVRGSSLVWMRRSTQPSSSTATEGEASGSVANDQQLQQEQMETLRNQPSSHQLRFQPSNVTSRNLRRIFLALYRNNELDLINEMGQGTWENERWALYADLLRIDLAEINRQRHPQQPLPLIQQPMTTTATNHPANTATIPTTTATNHPANTATTPTTTTPTTLPMPPAPDLNAIRFVPGYNLRPRIRRDAASSTTSSNRSDTVYITNQSLRQYVWSVLKEAKEQGVTDLNWVKD